MGADGLCPICLSAMVTLLDGALKAAHEVFAAEIEALQKENERLRAKTQTQCAHYSRKHDTGGWTCPECGKRGLPQ